MRGAAVADPCAGTGRIGRALKRLTVCARSAPRAARLAHAAGKLSAPQAVVRRRSPLLDVAHAAHLAKAHAGAPGERIRRFRGIKLLSRLRQSSLMAGGVDAGRGNACNVSAS